MVARVDNMALGKTGANRRGGKETANDRNLAARRLVKMLNQRKPGLWSDTRQAWLCRTCIAELTSTDIDAGYCTQCGTKIRKD
jgi:hypothetical protein